MKLITTGYLISDVIYLTNTEEVERQFVQILNDYRDAFWEEEALQFMKDVDTAKRQGDYGVVTDFGESCITCLSTGCKFGLCMMVKQLMQAISLVDWHIERKECR